MLSVISGSHKCWEEPACFRINSEKLSDVACTLIRGSQSSSTPASAQGTNRWALSDLIWWYKVSPPPAFHLLQLLEVSVTVTGSRDECVATPRLPQLAGHASASRQDGLALLNTQDCQPESLWNVHTAQLRRQQPSSITSSMCRRLCGLLEMMRVHLGTCPQATQDNLAMRILLVMGSFILWNNRVQRCLSFVLHKENSIE